MWIVGLGEGVGVVVAGPFGRAGGTTNGTESHQKWEAGDTKWGWG